MQFVERKDFLFIGKVSHPGQTVRTRDIAPLGGDEDPASRFPGSATLCWHCCHACDPGALALPMPIDYDERTDAFTVVGTFCSFACMKAFNATRNSSRKDVNYLNIALFARRFYGRCTHIQTAPPRVALAAFGGPMSIDEFRAAARDPPYPPVPFAARGEPVVVVAADDSHNVSVVPHESDPVVRVETTRSAAALAKAPPPPPKKPVVRRKKREPVADAAQDDAMLKLRRTGGDDAGPQQAGGPRCILETMLNFRDG